MSKKIENNLLVALDIGTAKIAGVVIALTEEGPALVGHTIQPSRGLRRGSIVNIESTVQSIQRTIEVLQEECDCTIHAATVGLSSAYIQSFSSHGIVAIRDHEVTHEDIDRVIEAAKAVAIPTEQKILHILPQDFVIDQQYGIRNPLGMSGVRLEAHVHMVTGLISAAQNVVKCVRRTGVEVEDVTLEPLAAASACLNDDQKELGVCLIDFGCATTKIVVFVGGHVRHTAILPCGGEQITNDIAVALRIPSFQAEELKCEHGNAMVRLAKSQQPNECSYVQERLTRKINVATLASIIEPRVEELLEWVKSELHRKSLLTQLGSGFVVTGGGSQLKGLTELVEECFHLPTTHSKITAFNVSKDIEENPQLTTAVGLLAYSFDQEPESTILNEGQKWYHIFGRIKRWVRRFS